MAKEEITQVKPQKNTTKQRAFVQV